MQQEEAVTKESHKAQPSKDELAIWCRHQLIDELQPVDRTEFLYYILNKTFASVVYFSIANKEISAWLQLLEAGIISCCKGADCSEKP